MSFWFSFFCWPLENDVSQQADHDRRQDGAVDGDQVLVESSADEVWVAGFGCGGIPSRAGAP